MYCTRLAENTGRKNRHFGIIAQLCRIFATNAFIDNWKKKLVKQQYLPHMSPQYGEVLPTSGCYLLTSLGHPSKFQRISRLAFVMLQRRRSPEANQTLHDV